MSGFILYALCKLLGLQITSFYRSPSHNVEVGGVSDSKHQYFQAIDVVGASDLERSFFAICGYKVLKNDDGTHDHIEATAASELFFRYDAPFHGSAFVSLVETEIEKNERS